MMSSEKQRRLILHMSVSLDGFSAAARDTPGTVDEGGVRHQANLEVIGQVGQIALGRGAYPIALGGGSALVHGVPQPQRFELVTSTVHTDGSTVQVLRPTGDVG